MSRRSSKIPGAPDAPPPLTRRERRRGDVYSTLDALMVAAAAAVPVWALWLGPSLAGRHEGGILDTARLAALPVLGLLLLATAVRFALGARGPTIRSRGWIIGAIVVLPLSVVVEAYIDARPLEPLALAVPLGVIYSTMFLRLRLVARVRGSAWRGPALLSMSALLIVVVAMGLSQSRAVTEQQQRTADRLMDAVVLAEHLGSVADRATSGVPRVALPAQDEWTRETRRLQVAFDRAGRGSSSGAGSRLQPLLARYTSAVEGQQRLVELGRTYRAMIVHAMVVEPAHAKLLTAARATVSDYRRAATIGGRRGRIGTVAVLAMSLSLLILLLLGFGGVRQRAHVLEAQSRAARDSERRFRALVGGSADIITVIDQDTCVTAHPETVERVLGYDDGSIQGRRLADLLGPQQAEHTLAALATLAARPGRDVTLDWSLRRADGGELEAEASIVNHLDDPMLNGFVVTVRDMTDRNRLEAELEHQAFHDRLTGLPNRGLVEQRLRHAFARSGRELALQALVFLDIDDFKAVNDAMGHPIGDDLLREVAGRLRGCVRDGETLARVGGDAFAILIEGADGEAEAHVVAGRMLAALADPIEIAGGSHVVSASIGIALSDGAGDGPTRDETAVLLRNAELAMYEAKVHDGSHIEVFAARMHDAVTKRLALKDELVLALRREEFSLVYQPIVDIDQRRIVGYEALVRWIHPERGMVSPADFIPIAEQTGLIVDLGTWVLREACRQMAQWAPLWPDERYVSVNVAGQQVQRDELVEEVRAALVDAGLPAHQLLLEVTESSLIQDPASSGRRMSELRDLGTRLAIDDFGTGYSSLSYLHQFAVDVLKIDKSFIDNVCDGGRGRALVDAIVNMASSLELKVVAEGIEEAEQVEALLELRCGFGQGYHYSRPLPVADVALFELAPGPAATTAVRAAR